MNKITYIMATSFLLLTGSCSGNSDKKTDDNADSMELTEMSSSIISGDESSASDFSSNSSDVSATSEENASDLLKEYKEVVEKYTALAKKAAKGDVEALAEYQEYLTEAESLADRLNNVKGGLSSSEISQLNSLTKTFSNTLKTYKIDPAKIDAAVSKVKSMAEDYAGSVDAEDVKSKAKGIVSGMLGGDDDDDDDDDY